MKRILIATAGGTLTIVGIALLVLPGPGFVLVAAGLAILATQFAWAERPLRFAKQKARAGLNEVATSRLRAGLAVAGAIGVAGVGIAEMTGLNLPLVNVVTAVMLIISGLALLATVVYARRTGPQDPHAAEGDATA